MTPADRPLPTPGLVPRLVVAAVVLTVPLLALGVGLALALSAATPGVRGGLVAAMITWGIACAAAVGSIGAFAWTIVGPARRLARVASDLSAGGDAEGLPVDRGDEFGAAARAVVALETERRRLEDVLRNTALRDAETGFYDARELRVRLDNEEGRARRHQLPLTLIVVEVATATVEEELVRVVAALQAAARPTDVLARLGATSFAVLLPNTPGPGAQPVIGRLRAALGEALLGVGVAGHPDVTGSGEQLLRVAVEAADASRAEGGGPVAYGS